VSAGGSKTGGAIYERFYYIMRKKHLFPLNDPHASWGVIISRKGKTKTKVLY